MANTQVVTGTQPIRTKFPDPALNQAMRSLSERLPERPYTQSDLIALIQSTVLEMKKAGAI